MLMGRDPLVKKLALVDLSNDHTGLLNTLAGYDGVLNHLPLNGTLDLFDHTVWELPARSFAWHGHSVLAPDLPGHGRSEGPALGSAIVLGVGCRNSGGGAASAAATAG